ncbi:MAG TPA: hypothetical protein VIH71_16565 [Solirubrobacteraceae bacterium]
MTTLKAEEIRIPRRAREAVAQHQEVVVFNRERPAYVIVHPEDYGRAVSSRRGRSLGEALFLLEQAAPPDPAFAEDMEAVLEAIGPAPADPWELSETRPSLSTSSGLRVVYRPRLP